MSRDVIPNTSQQIMQITMPEFKGLLEFAISRLPTKSQADYRALHNVHTADGSGPLLGIMKSNAYGTGLYDSNQSSDVAQYGAVCKIGSRINHRGVTRTSSARRLPKFFRATGSDIFGSTGPLKETQLRRVTTHRLALIQKMC